MWTIISVYGASHALVDAACAAILFAIVGIGRYDPQDLLLFVILYDVLAFATQPVFGLLADTVKVPAYSAVLGIALVAVSTLLVPLPLLAAVTAGVGNAIFHVGGGIASLNLAPGKAALPGIYVAPGALGLMIGTLVGKSGGFVAWPFILLLVGSAVLILRIPGPETAAHRTLPASLKWFETVIVLLLFSIAVRGMVGLSLVLPWKSDPALLIALTSAVVLGKALGGILGDRFGWTAVAVTGLAVSAPLLAFLPHIPAAAILGTFLFNMSMPITLVCLAQMLPGKSGFAFGLTAFALILGAGPAFTPLRDAIGHPLFIFAAILISIAALYGALRLYAGYYGDDAPVRRRQTQPEKEKFERAL
jgi:FSR family fosmidomycin resistance protein-like MFS transporter